MWTGLRGLQSTRWTTSLINSLHLNIGVHNCSVVENFAGLLALRWFSDDSIDRSDLAAYRWGQQTIRHYCGVSQCKNMCKNMLAWSLHWCGYVIIPTARSRGDTAVMASYTNRYSDRCILTQRCPNFLRRQSLEGKPWFIQSFAPPMLCLCGTFQHHCTDPYTQSHALSYNPWSDYNAYHITIL